MLGNNLTSLVFHTSKKQVYKWNQMSVVGCQFQRKQQKPNLIIFLVFKQFYKFD